MSTALANRVLQLKPSATIAVTQRAAELKAQGVDVIAFGVGQPDFDTPVHIRDAAKTALDEGATRYTRVRGVDALLKAIQSDCERRRGFKPDLSEIVCSVGAKHTLFNLGMVLYEPGDEVIVPAPYWVSYPSQVEMMGAKPVIVSTREEEGFRLTPEALEAAVTARTKALILCTPSNPTGAAYDEASLRALAEVAKKHDFWIIVDEIYAELVYGGFEQKSMIQVAPELKERLIIVDGVSKTYAMTGWRIGWAIAPAAVAKAVEKIQGQSTTNPAGVSQYAAAAALVGDRAPIDEMRTAFTRRREIVLAGLNAIEGISCREPEGAFYVFPNVKAWVGKKWGDQVLEDDMAVARYLLDEAGCALVPGTAFGAPGYLRMSYATSEALIREGLRRIEAAGAKLT